MDRHSESDYEDISGTVTMLRAREAELERVVTSAEINMKDAADQVAYLREQFEAEKARSQRLEDANVAMERAVNAMDASGLVEDLKRENKMLGEGLRVSTGPCRHCGKGYWRNVEEGGDE